MKKLSKYFEDMVLSPEPNAFCMLKPGFNQYKDEFERLLNLNGWKIIKHCTKQFTRPEIEDFYLMHKDQGFYNKLCDYMITEACECYSCYKRCKDPYKEMGDFKKKIRDEWGEDEMRNGMHSSDSDDNVKREIELAFNCVNERLVLSKNKRGITPEEFYTALKSYTGEYKLGNINGTFDLEKYCTYKKIDPGFYCFDENDRDFSADTLMVEDRGGTHIRVLGINQTGKSASRAFDDFDVFVEDVLDRYGEHGDDPITGEEHLQNIYDILIGKQ